MAKRVFFSFHYQDVADFRANVVRNHWTAKQDREEAGYFDASIWEAARLSGSTGLKRLINGALEGTSNTCVLVGSETYRRPWVRYELLKSFRRGNHLFAVHINSITDKHKRTKPLGPNPLAYIGVTYSPDGRTGTLWERGTTDWTRYSEIDGSASFSCNVGPEYQGKGFNLGKWYPLYDWVSQDGFNNFSSWTR